MEEIKVRIENGEYFECPLRSDVNSCQATPSSDVNSCPVSHDDEEDNTVYDVPDYCPLKSETGGVSVTLDD